MHMYFCIDLMFDIYIWFTSEEGGGCSSFNFLWGHLEVVLSIWLHLAPLLICLKYVLVCTSEEVCTSDYKKKKKRHIHGWRWHIRSMTNRSVFCILSVSLFCILSHLADHIYKHMMKFQSPLQSLRKCLCRTDQNRNANQSGSNRWYVCKANFFLCCHL